jgi:hypothetical protein
VANQLLEPEAQSLENRYGLGSTRYLGDIVSESERGAMKGRIDQVNVITQTCLRYKITSLAGATLQEEQGRELSPENECEQEIQRPRPMKPCQHVVHETIKRFVRHGTLSILGSQRIYHHAFASLQSTSAADHPGIQEWPKHELLVSNDFLKTVETKGGENMDSFMRPVNWILSRTNEHGKAPTYLIISPTEANELLPDIVKHKLVTLHTYSPRIRLNMRSLEDLAFCALPEFFPTITPPALSVPVPTLINLFAGQVYFRDFKEYERVHIFLGLCYATSHARSDGFLQPGAARDMVVPSLKDCRFQVSPIGFLRALVNIRRKGQSFERSHMGALLRGEGLTEAEFE